MNDLINCLENNRFIDDVRQNLTFNATEYAALIALLQEIETRTRHQKTIDKRLASSLYEITKLVWIWHLNLKHDPNHQDRSIVAAQDTFSFAQHGLLR